MDVENKQIVETHEEMNTAEPPVENAAAPHAERAAPAKEKGSGSYPWKWVFVHVFLAVFLFCFAVSCAVLTASKIDEVRAETDQVLGLEQFRANNSVSQESKDQINDTYAATSATFSALISIIAIGAVILLFLAFYTRKCAGCMFTVTSIIVHLISVACFGIGVFFLIGWRNWGIDQVTASLEAYCDFTAGDCRAAQRIDQFPANQRAEIAAVCNGEVPGIAPNQPMCSEQFQRDLAAASAQGAATPETVQNVNMFCATGDVCDKADDTLNLLGAMLVALAVITIFTFILACCTISKIKKAKKA